MVTSALIHSLRCRLLIFRLRKLIDVRFLQPASKYRKTPCNSFLRKEPAYGQDQLF
jgi:hypothetical protein